MLLFCKAYDTKIKPCYCKPVGFVSVDMRLLQADDFHVVFFS